MRACIEILISAGVAMTVFCRFLFGLDRSIFQAINSLAGRSSILDWFARVGADDHIVPVVLILLVILTLFLSKNHKGREAAFKALICAFLAALLSTLLVVLANSLFFRPKPFSSQRVLVLLYNSTDSAFPSNAAVLAFAVAFAVFLYKRRVGLLMIALGVFLGFSRVMAGVHYPLDIASGLLLGLSSALLVRAFEFLYGPLARRLNSALYRVLCAWEIPRPGRGEGGAKC